MSSCTDRIEAARQELVATLIASTADLTAPRPADPTLVGLRDDLLARLADVRGRGGGSMPRSGPAAAAGRLLNWSMGQ